MEETPQERETAEEEMSIEMTSMRGEDVKGETARITVTDPKGTTTTSPNKQAQHVGMATETSVKDQVQEEVTGMKARAIHQAMVDHKIQVVRL